MQIVMKVKYSFNSYCDMIMILRDIPYDLYLSMMNNNDLNTFLKGLLHSIECTRVRSVPSHIGKVGSLMYL